ETAPGIPERLGEFRIVREISHGGMGRIYESKGGKHCCANASRPFWQGCMPPLVAQRRRSTASITYCTTIFILLLYRPDSCPLCPSLVHIFSSGCCVRNAHLVI